MGKGLGKSSSNKVINQEEQEVAPGNKKFESCLPKGQAGIQVFFRALDVVIVALLS